MKITMFSQSLQRHTDLVVALPSEPVSAENSASPYYQRPVKMLLTLHGYQGSGEEFMLTGNLHQLAEKYNLAVVCPSGENSFYLNQTGTGRAYDDFVSVELPAFLRRHLGLFASREDTLVCGFSMGGFGALHVGLGHPEQFCGIVAVSSALVIYTVAGMRPGYRDIADYDYYRQVFGEPDQVLESRNNPEVLLKYLKAEKRPIPSIYMACGTEDPLLESNQTFAQFLNRQGISFRFDQEMGIHNRVFAIPHLEAGIRYQLELQQKTQC